MCAANGEPDGLEQSSTYIYVVALVLAFLANNKWLNCTAHPKTSFCAEVALCLLTGIMVFVAFIATMEEQSLCFSCEQVPYIDQIFGQAGFDYKSLLSLMRYRSVMGVITSLFLLIAFGWMVLGRVPRTASMELFRGHAILTDETASTVRHLLTSRVYAGLIAGVLFNTGLVIYYGPSLHDQLESLENARAQAAAAGASAADRQGLLPSSTQWLFLLILLYVFLAVCVLASAFNGWKHLQHWRTVTKVAPAQVAPTPTEGNPGEADGLDAEHSRLIRVGSKSLISASRLPAFMCSTLACGSLLIALVVSIIITAAYTLISDEGVREQAKQVISQVSVPLAILVSGTLSRMVLRRCLLHAEQHKAVGDVLPMQRPICFAWYEALYLFQAIPEGIWIGLKRLGIAIGHAAGSLLRTDRPSYAEDSIFHDKVFRSYAAVLCLERDAEASRRQAGATHFDSGVLAVESKARARHTALWCLGWLVACLTPLIIIPVFLNLLVGGGSGQASPGTIVPVDNFSNSTSIA